MRNHPRLSILVLVSIFIMSFFIIFYTSFSEKWDKNHSFYPIKNDFLILSIASSVQIFLCEKDIFCEGVVSKAIDRIKESSYSHIAKRIPASDAEKYFYLISLVDYKIYQKNIDDQTKIILLESFAGLANSTEFKSHQVGGAPNKIYKMMMIFDVLTDSDLYRANLTNEEENFLISTSNSFLKSLEIAHLVPEFKQRNISITTLPRYSVGVYNLVIKKIKTDFKSCNDLVSQQYKDSTNLTLKILSELRREGNFLNSHELETIDNLMDVIDTNLNSEKPFNQCLGVNVRSE